MIGDTALPGLRGELRPPVLVLPCPDVNRACDHHRLRPVDLLAAFARFGDIPEYIMAGDKTLHLRDAGIDFLSLVRSLPTHSHPDLHPDLLQVAHSLSHSLSHPLSPTHPYPITHTP